MDKWEVAPRLVVLQRARSRAIGRFEVKSASRHRSVSRMVVNRAETECPEADGGTGSEWVTRAWATMVAWEREAGGYAGGFLVQVAE